MSHNVWSLKAAVDRLTAAFRQSGSDTAALDARILVSAATSYAREYLIAEPDQRLTTEQISVLQGFMERRQNHEPVSRIIGTREFYGRLFEISPATLDPRPETETIVECVLEFTARNGLTDTPLRILDVGTGSGILVLTLLAELPRATGVGTDISAPALRIAARNARNLALEARATFTCQRGLDEVTGPFDILVSNPPYIASEDIAGLVRDVRDYDPHSALDGGPDGLDVYRSLAPHLSRVVPTGIAAFEVGANQADDVIELLTQAYPDHSAARIKVKKDLAGHTRCVAIQTHS